MPLLHQLAIDLPAVGNVRVKPPPTASINPAYWDFRTGIPLVLNAAIILAAVIMIILIAAAGVRYMTANGNEEATTKARQMLFGSVVGFVLIIGTWAIMRFIFGLIGYSFG